MAVEERISPGHRRSGWKRLLQRTGRDTSRRNGSLPIHAESPIAEAYGWFLSNQRFRRRLHGSDSAAQIRQWSSNRGACRGTHKWRGLEGVSAMGDESKDEKLSEDLIYETLADSFPASDPPSWTLGREKPRPAGQTDSSL